MTEDHYFNKYEESLTNINSIIIKLNEKSCEIKAKITELSNKVHLELEKSTHLLQFQHHIIANEINYIETLKTSINYNLVHHLYNLSENISMICITYMNIYKDIHPTDDFDYRYKVKSSSKKDLINKLILDINFNLAALDKLSENISHFRESTNKEKQVRMFHIGTLDNDIEAVQNHIKNEVQKYRNIYHTKVSYFTEFINILNQQLVSSKICAFTNTAF